MAEDWDLSAVVRSCKFTKPIANNNQTQTQYHQYHHHYNNNHNHNISPFSAATSSQPQTHHTIINNINSFPFLKDETAFRELQNQFFFYKPPPPPPLPQPDQQPQIRMQPRHHHQNYHLNFNNNNNNNIPNVPSSAGGDRNGVVFKPPCSGSAVLQEDARAAARREYLRSRMLHGQTKKKGNVKKTVRTLTKENLYSDYWSWRKYGQKPIKGSPYPRNYYRCSSCRGCPARKQVERCQTVPELYVVAYSGEHRHNRRINTAIEGDQQPSSSNRLPPPPPPPALPVLEIPSAPTAVAPPPVDEEEEDHLFANLDDIDLFDGFFFDFDF